MFATMETILFFASKIVMWFLTPVSMLFILSLFAILRIRRNHEQPRARRAALIMWIVAYILFIPLTGELLIRLWESPPGDRSALAAHAPYDAAIVLGGSLDPANSRGWHKELNKTAERLTDAVRLYREGLVDKILFTGGSGTIRNQEWKEAPIAASFMESLGVEPADLILESDSRNTFENARNSFEIVREKGLRNTLLITSALHMPRSIAAFRRAGFTVDGSASDPIAEAANAPLMHGFAVDTMREPIAYPEAILPSAEAAYRLSIFWHETFGFFVYKILGRL